MTKKELQSYLSIKREADRLQELIEATKAKAQAPKSQQLDGMPHGGASPQGSELENLVLRHIELQELYNAKLDELRAALLKIERAIDSLEPNEREVLRLHYILGWTWEQVSVAVNYSWRQTHRIHARALRKLEAMEDKDL